MADQEEKKMDVVAALAKKKRLTPEERLTKLKEEIQSKADKAAQRARNTQARRTQKADLKKAASASERSKVADTMRNQIARMAANAQLSLSATNVKIPSKGAKADHLQKYFNAAKARYYKRTKKASSFQRRALEAAQEKGINAKYVKIGRNKNIQDILQKAEIRKSKNTAKASKGEKRVAVLALAEQNFGLNEKELMSIVCVRKKAEKK